jgi:hypothetical protein
VDGVFVGALCVNTIVPVGDMVVAVAVTMAVAVREEAAGQHGLSAHAGEGAARVLARVVVVCVVVVSSMWVVVVMATAMATATVSAAASTRASRQLTTSCRAGEGSSVF